MLLTTTFMQYNFYPNEGECVRPDLNPPNEFSSVLDNSPSKSWRFFGNRNSQACRFGVTSSSIVTNGKIYGGVSSRFVLIRRCRSPPFSPRSSTHQRPGALRALRQWFRRCQSGVCSIHHRVACSASCVVSTRNPSLAVGLFDF
jgi:hypothetical protein